VSERQRSEWYTGAMRVLTALDIPDGATRTEVRRLIRDAYPFGERENWPYRKWCEAVKDFQHARARGYRPRRPAR